MKLASKLILSGVAMTLAFTGPTASAVVVYDFDVLVTGAMPQGTSPWATLTIQNSGADTVNMTLTHNAGSAQGQFISKLLLNIDPFATGLSIIPGSPKIVGWGYGVDQFTDASGKFDMYVNFQVSNQNGGADRLKPGESVSWQVTGNGLDENHFVALSQGNLNVFGLLHIQGIPPDGGSGKVAPVPEPGTLTAIAVGLAALASRRLKRK
ncbi:MAG: hypothetical protein C4340_00950 [Armatimonadota bacterium]